MATARQIAAMLNSHVQGDEEQLLAIAMQVAASEARRGRIEVSEELRSLVDEARSKRRRSHQRLDLDAPVPISRPRGELQSLLDASYPKVSLGDVVIRSDVREKLERLVLQQLHRTRLREFSQVPASRLLLVGPPGSGKTLTASALAGELHLPLFAVRLDSLITRYMGETAAKLRLVFDQVSMNRGVYLFDEFDAIGGRRSAENDVGEMRRVLNSFLQFFEEPNSTDSVIVATTNHPELLDRALFRRFDEVLEYGLPDSDAIRRLIRRELSLLPEGDFDWQALYSIASGLSQAEVVKACGDVLRSSILDPKFEFSQESLESALRDRHLAREAFFGPFMI